jgi:hypothetical protein
MFADGATHGIRALTQGETEPVSGATHPAAALFADEAIGAGRTGAVARDALPGFLRIWPRADLTRAATCAIAAGNRRAAFPAAGLGSPASIAATLAIETDFFSAAAQVVVWIVSAAGAHRRRGAAGLCSRVFRPGGTIGFDKAVGAALVLAQRMAGPLVATPRYADMAALAAVVDIGGPMPAEKLLAAGCPTRLATAFAMSAARARTALGTLSATGPWAAATSARGQPMLAHDRGDHTAEGRQHRAPRALRREELHVGVESRGFHG